MALLSIDNDSSNNVDKGSMISQQRNGRNRQLSRFDSARSLFEGTSDANDSNSDSEDDRGFVSSRKSRFENSHHNEIVPQSPSIQKGVVQSRRREFLTKQKSWANHPVPVQQEPRRMTLKKQTSWSVLLEPKSEPFSANTSSQGRKQQHGFDGLTEPSSSSSHSAARRKKSGSSRAPPVTRHRGGGGAGPKRQSSWSERGESAPTFDPYKPSDYLPLSRSASSRGMLGGRKKDSLSKSDHGPDPLPRSASSRSMLGGRENDPLSSSSDHQPLPRSSSSRIMVGREKDPLWLSSDDQPLPRSSSSRSVLGQEKDILLQPLPRSSSSRSVLGRAKDPLSSSSGHVPLPRSLSSRGMLGEKKDPLALSSDHAPHQSRRSAAGSRTNRSSSQKSKDDDSLELVGGWQLDDDSSRQLDDSSSSRQAKKKKNPPVTKVRVKPQRRGSGTAEIFASAMLLAAQNEQDACSSASTKEGNKDPGEKVHIPTLEEKPSSRRHKKKNPPVTKVGVKKADKAHKRSCSLGDLSSQGYGNYGNMESTKETPANPLPKAHEQAFSQSTEARNRKGDASQGSNRGQSVDGKETSKGTNGSSASANLQVETQKRETKKQEEKVLGREDKLSSSRHKKKKNPPVTKVGAKTPDKALKKSCSAGNLSSHVGHSADTGKSKKETTSALHENEARPQPVESPSSAEEVSKRAVEGPALDGKQTSSPLKKKNPPVTKVGAKQSTDALRRSCSTGNLSSPDKGDESKKNTTGPVNLGGDPEAQLLDAEEVSISAKTKGKEQEQGTAALDGKQSSSRPKKKRNPPVTKVGVKQSTDALKRSCSTGDLSSSSQVNDSNNNQNKNGLSNLADLKAQRQKADVAQSINFAKDGDSNAEDEGNKKTKGVQIMKSAVSGFLKLRKLEDLKQPEEKKKTPDDPELAELKNKLRSLEGKLSETKRQHADDVLEIQKETEREKSMVRAAASGDGDDCIKTRRELIVQLRAENKELGAETAKLKRSTKVYKKAEAQLQEKSDTIFGSYQMLKTHFDNCMRDNEKLEYITEQCHEKVQKLKENVRLRTLMGRYEHRVVKSFIRFHANAMGAVQARGNELIIEEIRAISEHSLPSNYGEQHQKVVQQRADEKAVANKQKGKAAEKEIRADNANAADKEKIAYNGNAADSDKTEETENAADKHKAGNNEKAGDIETEVDSEKAGDSKIAMGNDKALDNENPDKAAEKENTEKEADKENNYKAEENNDNAVDNEKSADNEKNKSKEEALNSADKEKAVNDGKALSVSGGSGQIEEVSSTALLSDTSTHGEPASDVGNVSPKPKEKGSVSKRRRSGLSPKRTKTKKVDSELTRFTMSPNAEDTKSRKLKKEKRDKIKSRSLSATRTVGDSERASRRRESFTHRTVGESERTLSTTKRRESLNHKTVGESERTLSSTKRRASLNHKTVGQSERTLSSSKRRESLIHKTVGQSERTLSSSKRRESLNHKTAGESERTLASTKRRESLTKKGEKSRRRGRSLTPVSRSPDGNAVDDSESLLSTSKRRESLTKQGKKAVERGRSVTPVSRSTDDRTEGDSESLSTNKRRESLIKQGKNAVERGRSVTPVSRSTDDRTEGDSESSSSTKRRKSLVKKGKRVRSVTPVSRRSSRRSASPMPERRRSIVAL